MPTSLIYILILISLLLMWFAVLRPDDNDDLYTIPGFQTYRFDQRATHVGQLPPHDLAMYMKGNLSVLGITNVCAANYEWF